MTGDVKKAEAVRRSNRFGMRALPPPPPTTHESRTDEMGTVRIVGRQVVHKCDAVRIKTCFCCSLTIATILIAIYTVLLYSLFIGLAGWGLGDTVANGDQLNSHYDSCLKEAEGLIRADNRKLQYKDGTTTIIVEDSTSYHCSLGLYTAELKHPSEFRHGLLILNLIIFVLLIIAAIMLVVALGLYIQWLLLPWVALMTIDVIRGIISVLFIFIYSHGNLARIAVGIFFLGVQFFHISLIMIVVAKFQRMHDKINGVDYKMQPPPDKVIMADGAQVYPTLPSNYAYSSNSPQMRRDGFYQPNSASYNTYVGSERRMRQQEADAARVYRPGPYDTMGSPYRQDPSNIGRTM
uniref:Pali-domain-containing protein n=1 Tax=Plectus sambesii TaxID=2011161 RepID=A0A914W624_9BILA